MGKNIWRNKKFCCCEHGEPIEMYVFQHPMIEESFYACPRYMKKDENHPNGHGPDEPSCTNRLSINDAVGIMNKLDRTAEEAAANGEIIDYTNMRIRQKSITATIVRSTDKEMLIGIKNERKVSLPKSAHTTKS